MIDSSFFYFAVSILFLSLSLFLKNSKSECSEKEPTTSDKIITKQKKTNKG